MSSPKYKMSDLPASVTQFTVGPFLDESSLSVLSRTCTLYRDLFKGTRSDRGKASTLLFCVLNPNEANLKRIQALLSEPQQEIKSIILIRVSGHEVYFSIKQDKWVSKKKWINVSPLEAGALCGDVHLVRRLLEKIPDNQKTQALVQLQEIKKKCTTDEAQSYICRLDNLRKAYKEYLEHYQNLANTENWKEIDECWGLVGEAQKNLPWFLLQVLCDPIPHHPIPDFTKEPPRACCLKYNEELDLDRFFAGSHYALNKGHRCYARSWRARDAGRIATLVDSVAIDSLYEVLPAELDKVIKLLSETLESSAVLDSDKSLSRPSPSL